MCARLAQTQHCLEQHATRPDGPQRQPSGPQTHPAVLASLSTFLRLGSEGKLGGEGWVAVWVAQP